MHPLVMEYIDYLVRIRIASLWSVKSITDWKYGVTDYIKGAPMNSRWADRAMYRAAYNSAPRIAKDLIKGKHGVLPLSEVQRLQNILEGKPNPNSLKEMLALIKDGYLPVLRLDWKARTCFLDWRRV